MTVLVIAVVLSWNKRWL